jgi:glucokinase
MPTRGTIGIDIGGTKTLCALFDEQFEVIEEVKTKTEAERGEKAFTEKLTQSLEELIQAGERKSISVLTVGIGCAGYVDPKKGTMKLVPNVPFLKGYPLCPRIAKLTGAQVSLVNDVQAGLYGEFQFGAAAGCQDVIGVFMGTGIGGALIIDGKPYFGATGAAGDIGHYLLHALGPLSGSERDGVLDDVASRTAIAGDAAALVAKQQAPSLAKRSGTDVTKIRSQDLAAAIDKGDAAVEELVRSRSHIVGLALSNLVDFFNPDMVVLGGGMVEAMPKLIRDEVDAAIKKYSTPQAQEGLRVAVSKLKSHAVTTGAAKLAYDAFVSAPAKGDSRPARG